MSVSERTAWCFKSASYYSFLFKKNNNNQHSVTVFSVQIFYALVDQTLFGEQPLPHGDSSCVVAELKRKHTNLENVEGTHWEARFSHLLNYGAGGYEM